MNSGDNSQIDERDTFPDNYMYVQSRYICLHFVTLCYRIRITTSHYNQASFLLRGNQPREGIENWNQCIILLPLPAPSALSNGNAILQAAVMQNTAAEVNSGREGVIVKRNPAKTGAMTPVLYEEYQ